MRESHHVNSYLESFGEDRVGNPTLSFSLSACKAHLVSLEQQLTQSYKLFYAVSI